MGNLGASYAMFWAKDGYSFKAVADYVTDARRESLKVGVAPESDVTDRWGREFFLNYRLEDLWAYSPDNSYGLGSRDVRTHDGLAAMHWRGNAHLFMPCLHENHG